MSKQVFYLKDELVFVQSFDGPFELIVWVYKYNNKTYYSKALHELAEKYYNEN